MDAEELAVGTAIPASSCATSDLVGTLHMCLESAGTWAELGVLCDEVDRLYAERLLGLAEAEALAAQAVAYADMIASAGQDGGAEQDGILALVRPDVCPCCGGQEHWYNHGVRTCAKCHPHPGRQLPAARSAA
jgi:hypothetical protein